MKATPQTFDDLKISATFSVSDQNYSPMALGAMICAPHFIAAPAQLKLCLNNKNSFNLIDNFQRCNRRYHPNFRGQVNREKQLSLETLARLPNDASQASSKSASIKVRAKSNCNQPLSKRTNDEAKTNKSQAYGCEHAADNSASSQGYKQENTQALTSANAFISSDPYDFAWSAPIPDFTSVSKLMRCHEALSSPKQSDDNRVKKLTSAAAFNQTCAGFNGLNSSADDAYSEGNALNLLACKSMQDLKNIHQALSDDAVTASNNNAAEVCPDLTAHLYQSHELAITSPQLIADEYNTCSDLSKDQVSNYLEHGNDGDACNALNSLNLYIGSLIEHDPEALNKFILQSTCNLQGLSAVCQDQDVPKHVPNLSSLFAQNQSSDNDYSATDHMAMISLCAALKAQQAKCKANKAINDAATSNKRTTKENHKTEDELLLEQLNGSNELEVLNNYRMTFNYSLRSNYPEIGPFNQDLAHCDEAQDHTEISTRSQQFDKPKAPLITNMSQHTQSVPQESLNMATETQDTANCSHCATKALQSSSETKTSHTKKGKRNAKQAAVESDGPITFALESFVMNKLNDKGANSQTPKIKKHSFVKKHAQQ